MSEENSYQQDNPIMKRNLLLCVDAFGTLFRPRSPIAEQYGSVARSMGVTISDDEVAKSFKTGQSICSEQLAKANQKEDARWQ